MWLRSTTCICYLWAQCPRPLKLKKYLSIWKFWKKTCSDACSFQFSCAENTQDTEQQLYGWLHCTFTLGEQPWWTKCTWGPDVKCNAFINVHTNWVTAKSEKFYLQFGALAQHLHALVMLLIVPPHFCVFDADTLTLMPRTCMQQTKWSPIKKTWYDACSNNSCSGTQNSRKSRNPLHMVNIISRWQATNQGSSYSGCRLSDVWKVRLCRVGPVLELLLVQDVQFL